MKKQGEYTTLIFMIMTTLVGKGLGLLRDSLMAASYGTSELTDAFFLASKIPNNFFDLALGAAVSSTFIPLFNQIYKERGEKEAHRYANQFITALSFAAMLIMLLIYIFIDPVVKFLGNGSSVRTQMLAADFLIYMIPIILFAAVTFSFVGIMQSKGRFNIPAAISMFSNIVVVIYLIFYNRSFGMEGLAIALTVGWGIQMLVQVPFLKKDGYCYIPNFCLINEDIKKTVKMTIPIIISSWAQPVNVLVNTFLASYTVAGITILEYANRVYIIISGVIIYALTNYIYPKLSRYATHEDGSRFSSLGEKSLYMLFYFSLPIVGLVVIFRNEIIKVLFERGEFNPEDTSVIGSLLAFYIIGLTFLGVKEILSRMFFAKGDSKKPLKVTIVGVIFNGLVSIILVGLIGLGGLALATSLAALLMSVYLLYESYKEKILHIDFSSIQKLGGILIVDGFLFVLIYLISNYIKLDHSKLLLLIKMIGSGIIMLGLHIGVLHLLKIKLPTLRVEKGD